MDNDPALIGIYRSQVSEASNGNEDGDMLDKIDLDNLIDSDSLGSDFDDDIDSDEEGSVS